MTRLSTFVAAAAVVSFAGSVLPAFSQSAPARPAEPVMGPIARVGSGSIRGLVLDGRGLPLPGAIVSALGSTAAFAESGTDGRFSLRSLPPGPYTVRVHLDGYLPSRREIVEVRSSTPSVMSVALQLSKAGDRVGGPAVLAAGIVPIDFSAAGVAASRDRNDANDPDAGDDHSEAAWRLRHLKRTVLKSVDGSSGLLVDADLLDPSAAAGAAGRFGNAPTGMGPSIFNALPFSAQVNFVTTGWFDSAAQLLTPAGYASQGVAYVALGAPVGHWADVSVRGAFTQGGTASWFVAGSLAARQSATHRLKAGVSYSAQRYERSDPLAFATVTSGVRAVGSVYGFDEWTVSRRVSVGYGGSYTWCDYLDGAGLLSPRLAVTLTPATGFRLKTLYSRRSSAPGAEEFLPPSGDGRGLWLPPERTFSTLSPRQPFRAETTSHYELAVEHDIDSYVVGFRAFYQRVSDQTATLFAGSPAAPPTGMGHYYVTNVGNVEARGWAVSLSRSIVGPVRGSLDYSLTTARWRPNVDDAVAALLGAAVRRPELEQFHDVTTSIETAIRPTATRLYVVYRLNTAFARQMDVAGKSGIDGRFDVQVNQSLPFLNFASSEWEVLVAVRNLFRDAAGDRSTYDELLVMHPPKRIVGGVRVRF